MSNRILSISALMIAVGIFFIYVSPTWSGPIAATKAAIASDDQALAAAQTYTAQQSQLTAARNKIDPADLTRLATFLPGSVDNVGLILDLNGLAARSGLSLSNINIATPSAGSGNSSPTGALSAAGANPVGSVDLSLSAVGTYTALKTFLVGVEKSERLLDVHDISINGSDTGVYTYQMAIRIYWLR
ncbi:MAG: hypothetical protein ACYC6X_01095 [Minisyncoccota bacterium]